LKKLIVAEIAEKQKEREMSWRSLGIVEGQRER